MHKHDGGSEKPERRITEKNRRTYMKQLCHKLDSLVPYSVFQSYKENQFDRSITYIEQLRKRVEALKDKRDETMRIVNGGSKLNQRYNVGCDQSAVSCDAANPSTVVVKELDGGLRVFLTSKSVNNIPFSDVIRIVEDGGAEVVKGGYTTVGDKVVYIVHAKERFMRIGIDKTSVYEKLYELINRSS